MRIIVYCFSGTGNTKWVCERLAAELKTLGHTAELFSLTADFCPPPANGYDGVVVGYPVHAFNAPAPVLKFLKKLPAAHKYLPVWLVRTSGEPLRLNEAAGISPKRILKKKGYAVRGEFHYVMPYNIIFRHSDGMAARMKGAAEKVLPRHAALISAGKGELYKNGAFRRVVSFALRVEHPAMPLIGRRFKATEKCVGCGKCAAVCPQGNIKMIGGRPQFGKNCAACMACSFHCPQDAVKISLLNGWRVNGPYTFEGEPAADADVCRYCRKSYLRYFHKMEE